MTITLTAEDYPPRTLKHGGEKVTLAAGERVRIQTWNAIDGIVDVLPEVTVPEGKTWVASLTINIVETDV